MPKIGGASLSSGAEDKLGLNGQKMTEAFDTIGLVARRGIDGAEETVGAVIDLVTQQGRNIILEEDTAVLVGDNVSERHAARASLGNLCDLVVVIGGDGSLLGVSREVASSMTPVVGINRGGLGFLAAVSPDALKTEFDKIWAGQHTIEDHFLLSAEVWHEGFRKETSNALNDVVVHPGNMARMMEFELWVDDEYVYNQRSDGLIVASPTGSTAYSLSAGGPIMHPNLDAIVIVPMFPHTLTSRPLVIRGDASIQVKITHVRDQAEVTCDSQVNMALGVGDEVRINKYSAPLRLLYPDGHSFYESCRSKLDWASRLGGQTL
ncbi:MAG: NAD(+) kinase [Pseudomonadales bacterium]|nr:NAD(+) kinase [Pseudomonadales bacterium]